MPSTTKTDEQTNDYSEHALLSALLEKTPVSIYFKDRDSNFLLASRGLYERLGCTTLEEVVGHNDHDFFDATHANAAAADEKRILAGTADIVECVEEEVWPDGKRAWVSTVKLPLHDEHGAVVGTFGVSMDISAQKEIEQELREARDEAQAVGEELEATLEDLVSTQDQLVQAHKLEAIGQLAAGVAHEINTPIQFISDNMRFIADSVVLVRDAYAAAMRVVAEARRSGFAAGAIEALDQIHQPDEIAMMLEELPEAAAESLEGARRVAEIVGALKAFAHPGADTRDSVDLNEVVRSTVIVSRNEWKYVAEMNTDLAEGLPLIVGNRGRLQQALLILIVNSAQAIASLGSEQKGQITVATRTVEDAVEVSVRDTGPGVPDEIADRIFEPFFTTKEVGVGSGQGLALAHGIVVEQHHGCIDFESRTGAGTEFLIRLPLGTGR